MNAFDILLELQELDIRLTVEDGKLRVNAPRGVITAELKTRLSQHKAELLALVSESTPIDRIPRDGLLPLSVTQEQLWGLQQLMPDTAAYNMYNAFQLLGQLNRAALETALHNIVDRHEILRTVFPISLEGVPVQMIGSPDAFALKFESLLNSANPKTNLEAIIEAEVGYRFDLLTGPLFRATLVQVNSAEYALILVMHHTISDGYSFSLIYDELNRAYRDACEGVVNDWNPLPIQYADYAQWQQTWLSSEAGETARRFWQEQFAGDVPDLELPFDHQQLLKQSSVGSFLPVVLDEKLSQKLRDLCRREGVTLFAAVLTAFNIVLNHQTGQQDLTVCTPVAGRDRIEFDQLIGYFNNTLLLRTDLTAVGTMRDLLQQTQSTIMGALAHQTFPFSEVAAFPSLVHRPLSRAMVLVQEPTAQIFRLPGLKIRTIATFNHSTQYDLALELSEANSRLGGRLIYRAVLFEEETINQLIIELIDVLEKMVADLVGDIKILTGPSKSTTGNASISTWKQPYTAPRSDLENQLSLIWHEVLGVGDLGIHDDFFESGGRSLLALRLFTRIHNEFGVNLPLSTLFEATTIAQVAHRIQQSGEDKKWSQLVPIQPLGNKKPFFCIHGITGDVLWFRELGALFAPDRPFYGIQARGLDGFSEPFKDIEAMAGSYIDEIKSIQPRGPYYIGGASLGGTVALEMAHQLQERGEETGLLVIFDSAPNTRDPAGLRERHWNDYVRHVVNNFPNWIGAMRALGGKRVQQRALRKLRLGWKQFSGLQDVPTKVRVDSADLLDYGSELPINRQLLIEAHWHAENHHTARPYSKPVLLLQAQAQPLLSTKRPEHTWHYLANGSLKVITVPGSHEGIFEEPNVQILARELRAQIEAAEA